MTKSAPPPKVAVNASAATEPLGERRPVMGAIDVALGVLFLAGVWAILPVRWWPVDVVGTAIGAAFVASGALLLRGAAVAPRVAMIVAGSVLGIGLVTIAALAYTLGNLYGLYGPVGQGGAVLLGVGVLVLVPYLVVFPAAQVYFLLPRTR